MCWLYLPTLWSEDQRTSLALALVSAFDECSEIATDEVFVCICPVASGEVVEGGRVIRWP